MSRAKPRLCPPLTLRAAPSASPSVAASFALPALAPSQVALDLLAAHNQARASQRTPLPLLKIDARLQLMADQHAGEMAQARRIGHERFAERLASSGYPYRSAGENAASGYRTTPAVVAAWMASPPHRANILNADFVDVGFGARIGSDGLAYWCAVFGSPSR